MIQKAFLLKLLLLVIIIPSFGQIKISGNVLDQVAGKPISFVNIGILNANVGTISNDDGSFVIRIPASYLKRYFNIFSYWLWEKGHSYFLYFNIRNCFVKRYRPRKVQ